MIDLDAPVEKAESHRLLDVVRSGPPARRSGIESTKASVPPDNQERISRLVDTLDRRSSEAEREDRTDRDLVEQVVRGAQEGLEKAQDADPVLTRREQFGLEAVILTDGTRPSLTVRNGFVDVAAPELGDWASLLGMFGDPIRGVIAAVGRVNVPPAPGFAGTCFLVADDLVATNRQVLEDIAVEGPVWSTSESTEPEWSASISAERRATRIGPIPWLPSAAGSAIWA